MNTEQKFRLAQREYGGWGTAIVYDPVRDDFCIFNLSASTPAYGFIGQIHCETWREPETYAGAALLRRGSKSEVMLRFEVWEDVIEWAIANDMYLITDCEDVE